MQIKNTLGVKKVQGLSDKWIDVATRFDMKLRPRKN